MVELNYSLMEIKRCFKFNGINLVLMLRDWSMVGFLVQFFF